MPKLTFPRKRYTHDGPGGRRRIAGFDAVVGDYIVTPVQPTRAQAEATAIEFAKLALRGDYVPYFLHLRGWFSIVFRQPDGWFYSPPARVEEGSKAYGQGTYATIHEAVKAAKSHLAQCAYDETLSLDECRELIAYGDNSTLHWIAWQRAYEHLRALGYDDRGARQDAHLHERSFLIALTPLTEAVPQ